MDFGSVIAFGAVCIVVIPVLLLLVDLTATSVELNQKEMAIDSNTIEDKKKDTTEKEEPVETIEETTDSAVHTIDTPNNGWRCACEGGFLPPGLLQNLSGAEAVLRMSAGRCYHKKNV
ncbi:hypothetical protein FisN_18Lu038 [Fistulifera solaris]|uniref:Uncharacterized protein n=1 Tax=Fistulifera solaris TaxID=1519565 RepID=A0A1Z5K253_FISSO|nr:hypothetical protein FisN_18Lu038 [Fistulifera solaris]|eukprot:GAX20098.1 hypothetical protein FisN_18Lu038 [Fistulifera solaris]